MLDLLLKQSCILCASHNGGSIGICHGCLNDMPWHTGAHCPQCAMLSNGLLCGNCLNAPPHFDATHALLTYDYPLDRLLQHYKYRESLHLANTFAELWVNKMHPQSAIDLIIPMPMHATRLKQRGFNQALEIAKVISKKTRTALDYQACQRSKLTPPQASLPLKDRIKNIRGVFNCEKNLHGLNIALVDDVMTSGASLNELAKTLKQAGAAHVECWVIARTLPKQY
ncbi:ComF family protein [Methylotenera sp. G11]|uniref:ComF family protein n=1 Tax=Methylotenera sp. G11 TaxID=1506585 RepID=UPI000645957B|nr:ComF family protein [Methylotenera sp. G11]